MSEDTKLDEFVEAESGSSERETEDLARKTVCGIPPQDWTVARLGELVRVVSGNSLPTEYQNGKEGDHPVYKVSDMNATGNQKYVSDTSNRLLKEDLEEINHTLYPEGTTILPKVGAALLTNKRRLLTESSSFDNNVMGWVPDEINPEFLYYVSCMIDMEAVAQKGAVPSISKAIAKSLKVPSPPLPEQRNIATVLYTVDRAIEKTEEVIEQYKSLKSGILEDLLREGVNDHDQTERNIGPLTWNMPSSWSVKPIGELAELVHGHQFRTGDFSEDGKIPVLKIGQITASGIDFSGADCISEQELDKYKNYTIEGGSPLIALSGATWGKTGYFESYARPVLQNYRVGKVVTDGSKLDKRYLYYIMESSIFQKQLRGQVVRQAQENIGKSDFERIRIPIPQISEQERISSIMSDIEKCIQSENRSKRDLKSLKRGFMQDLLSGTVRTTDTNIEVPDEIAQHG